MPSHSEPDSNHTSIPKHGVNLLESGHALFRNPDESRKMGWTESGQSAHTLWPESTQKQILTRATICRTIIMVCLKLLSGCQL